MTISMMHLAPSLLLLFMIVLGIGPLALAWQDARRRTQENIRLRALRREARVAAGLMARRSRQGLALQWDRAGRS